MDGRWLALVALAVAQTAALGAVDDAAAGIASGLLSTNVQIGGALEVAVLAGVVVTQRAGDLLASGSTAVAAQVAGLQLAFLIAAGVAFTASLVAMVALRRDKPDPMGAAVVGVGS